MSKKILVLAGLLGLFVVALPASAQGGPPPYITLPIQERVEPPGLENGHFVFGQPAPIAQSPGSASYAPATTSAAPLKTGTEVDVSNAPDSYEGETSGAAFGSLIVGTSNHIYPGNCSASAAPNTFGDCAVMAYASSDDGSTFGKTTISRTWNGTTFGITFDPAVDVDKNGTFYFSFGGAPLSGSYPNSIGVSKSSDGITWTTPVAVTYNRTRAFADKYYLAIDRSNSAFADRIYVSWDRNQGNNQILYLSYSSDGGASWSAPVKVNDGKTRFERVIGAYPAVDQNTGVVYDSWHDYAKNIIYVDKSTNGGASWGTDVAVATTHAGFGTDIGCVGGRAQGPAHALKVGPSGALYLVYADPVAGRGFDILLTKSTNGGASWSAPISLNDDSGSADQFHPTLSVDSGPDGRDKVTVSWYDRRDDPNNCYAYVYATQSTDSGNTWSANARETSVASDFDGNPNGPGDYSSSTPFSKAVWPFFSDHRSTNPETSRGGGFDIYTVNVE